MQNIAINVYAILAAIFCSLLLISTHCYADYVVTPPTNTPENIRGTTEVTAETVINLISNSKDIVIVDSRINDRPNGHIEGSINLPDVNTNCQSLSKIIKTKSTPVVFYCNGVKCGRSGNAVKIAIDCGYSTTYWYRDGFEDWLSRSYPYVTSH